MSQRLKVKGGPHQGDHAKWALLIFQCITYVGIMVSQLSFLSENLLNRSFYAVSFSSMLSF